MQHSCCEGRLNCPPLTGEDPPHCSTYGFGRLCCVYLCLRFKVACMHVCACREQGQLGLFARHRQPAASLALCASAALQATSKHGHMCGQFHATHRRASCLDTATKCCRLIYHHCWYKLWQTLAATMTCIQHVCNNSCSILALCGFVCQPPTWGCLGAYALSCCGGL